MGLGVLRVERHRLLVERPGLGVRLPGETHPQLFCPQQAIVGVHVLGALAGKQRALVVAERNLQGRGDLLAQLVLDGEDVFELAVVALRPQVVSGCRLDQLGGHAHPVGGLAHASFEYVSNAQVAAHFLDLDRRALVGEHRVAGDDEEPRYLRKRGDDVVGDAVGEVLLLGIGAHVVEWQDGDRGLVRHRRGGARLGGGGDGRFGFEKRYPVHPHRPGDVLDTLLAEVLKIVGNPVPHLLEDGGRYVETARRRHLLQARRHVHAVAVDIVALDDDVAHVDADAKLHPLLGGGVGVVGVQLLLDPDGAADRGDGARELGQHAVAGLADDASAMSDDRLVHGGAVSGQGRKGAVFIRRHQPAVAGHVGAEDRG